MHFLRSWPRVKKKKKEQAKRRVAPPPRPRRSLRRLSGAQDPRGALLPWHCSGTHSVGGRTHWPGPLVPQTHARTHAHIHTRARSSSYPYGIRRTQNRLSLTGSGGWKKAATSEHQAVSFILSPFCLA